MALSTTPDLRDQITEELARQLFSADLKLGDFLPKELDLTEQFGVSRATVRSALATFTSHGIIVRISGLGTRVQDYQDWNILSPQVTTWITQYGRDTLIFAKEIFRFRKAVEPYISMEAARRATAKDLMQIETAWYGMKAAIENDELIYRGKHFQEFDAEFHEAIYQASHNLVWVQIGRSTKPAVFFLIKKTTEAATELSDSLERHRRLLEAIRLRDAEAARKACESIIDRAAFDLELSDLNEEIKQNSLAHVAMGSGLANDDFVAE
ncbi:FadR/GntR family transcriptional regulator [Pseudovibrio sp. Tun.PSC04-5.I4]|uniref:FadR/GntR family transcriptional regulator n=1 Tax=Pseudovibrio sp. Tun.PSC04-5.I4 TaxID=1798213 RepID=UPI00088A4ABA|nr:FadR/GntR family transcriptional regulator [Pseudovibrio sp. Tun.PSC04-5.I4]SDQ19565.1 DNA-binding transcriptional regulator, FadR family [Pseudovibrio sp. Tun.PSC04-5.I4]